MLLKTKLLSFSSLICVTGMLEAVLRGTGEPGRTKFCAVGLRGRKEAEMLALITCVSNLCFLNDK